MPVWRKYLLYKQLGGFFVYLMVSEVFLKNAGWSKQNKHPYNKLASLLITFNNYIESLVKVSPKHYSERFYETNKVFETVEQYK